MTSKKYEKALQMRKEKQLRQGEKDAIDGKPPEMDELAYIQGYEKGLASRTNNENNEFLPDWASPPGDTILDIFEEKGKLSLMKALILTEKEMNELLNGDMEITEKMAETLAKQLGGTKEFWISREANYREGSRRLGKIKPPSSNE